MSTSGNQATIIVVNDDPIQAGVMVGFLEHAGYRALEFHGVTKALGHMQGQAQGKTPDLIVTDLHMPEIDGWRFCRLLRSPEFSHLNTVPIIIVSATYKGADTARIAADLGASAFLHAPVDAGIFLEIVGRVLLGEIVASQPRMLLVDDDKVFCNLARQLFESHGYKLDVARTGMICCGPWRVSGESKARRLFAPAASEVLAGRVEMMEHYSPATRRKI